VTRYIVRRLLLVLVAMLAISMLVFAGLRMLKGDLVTMLLGQTGISGAWDKFARPEEIEAYRRMLGLDKPVPIQYLNWLRLVLRGEFGRSAYSNKPVIQEIARTIPVTVQLAVMATLVAWVLGIPVGLISALKPDSLLDSVLRFISTLGLAIPGMWLGALIIVVPAILWGWTPLKPYVPITKNPVLSVSRMAWPALTLGFGMAAWLMRMTRAMMLEVLQQDYITTARAKGLKEVTVLTKHALKNSLIPVITASGGQFGGLLAGTMIIENLFMLPGMGRLLVESIFLRDYAIVQAAVLLITLSFTLINLLVDILYAFVDPRIRYT